MSVPRMYLFLVLATVLMSDLASASLLLKTMLRIPMSTEPRECNNNTDEACSETEKCINRECINLCPGPCGTDSLCHAQHHTLTCSCARCYEGNPYKICKQLPGYLYWKCLITDKIW